MPKNAYIHIPFCRGNKCNYCSFVSVPDLKHKTDYLVALEKQIATEYLGEPLNTLYFGGGTPSVLKINEVQSLLKNFNFSPTPEITFEVNPDDVNLKYFKDLKGLGINRISIGSQTFDDKILKIIGRRHNSKQIESALECAQNAGFKNISLDLIYGLPNQTTKGFTNDLEKAVVTGVQHISLYGLKIEAGCFFYKNPPQMKMADLDTQADMYINAINVLQNAGYEHYEISNFSLLDFNSKHNMNYWDNNNYYGFGCSASGYIDKTRYQMEPDLIKYIQNPLKHNFEQTLTEQEIIEESIFLGLRKSKGINLQEINQQFGINFEEKYAEILTKYPKYFIKTQNGYALTSEGLLISNEILAEFIE